MDELKQPEPRRFAGMSILRPLFDEHRRNCKAKTGWSFNEILGNPDEREKLINKAKQIKKTVNPTDGQIWETFQVYHGSISHFLPSIAVELLKTIAPTCVLDPCAGWGGRALACGARGIKYIGIDSNPDLKQPYDQLKQYLTNDSIFINEYAENVDFSQYQYDCVLTSPPFYYKEHYVNMKDYMDFDEQFVKPVFSSAWSNLAAGGWMAVNIPIKMFPVFEKMLGTPDRIMHFNYNTRISGYTNADSIYLWKKMIVF